MSILRIQCLKIQVPQDAFSVVFLCGIYKCAFVAFPMAFKAYSPRASGKSEAENDVKTMAAVKSVVSE